MSSASRRATHLGLVLLVSMFSTGLLSAQLQTHKAAAPDAHRIVLDVVVTPKSGRDAKPVADLKEGDFTLLDNKTPHPITSFRAVSGSEPVSVIILVDAVNADYTRVNIVRQELDRFLSSNGGHLAHPTTIAIFSDTGTQIQQGYSTDGNAMKTTLDQFTVGLRSIRRSAGFYGATERFDLSLKTIKQFTAAYAQQPGRKIILWVSPGWPILSGPGIQLDHRMQEQVFHDVVGLTTALQQSRITLYGVDPLGAGQDVGRMYYYQGFMKGVSKSSQVDVGNLSLQVLSLHSGGLAIGSSNDITALLQTCLSDLDAYYEISFDASPAEHVDEYHSIDFKLAQPGLIARTRAGYYAQP